MLNADIISALEDFAPASLQESWDNTGVQVGSLRAECTGVLLCVDVTPAVVDEARQRGCSLIISHHPLIFRGLKQIVAADTVQRAVMKAIKHDIVVVAMHTNMDNARGGVNFKIAEKLGLENVDFFARKKVGDIEGGSGVVGMLPASVAADDFIVKVKQAFGVECAMCNELLRRPVRKVAICGGGGDFLLPQAIALGADAFITGEMHYHQYFGHEQEIQICVIGHYQSEQYTSEVFSDILAKECPTLHTEIAETVTNPIYYY